MATTRQMTIRPEREDAHYTLKGVRCPATRTQGYSKTVAEPGDLLTWQTRAADGSVEHLMLGRVVGRVDARGDGKQMETVSGWIAVIALADSGTFTYERWVDPAWVVDIHRPCPAFFALFMGGDPEQLLRMTRYGSLSASALDYHDGRPVPRHSDSCSSCGHREHLPMPLEHETAEARYGALPHLAPEGASSDAEVG